MKRKEQEIATAKKNAAIIEKYQALELDTKYNSIRESIMDATLSWHKKVYKVTITSSRIHQILSEYNHPEKKCVYYKNNYCEYTSLAGIECLKPCELFIKK